MLPSIYTQITQILETEGFNTSYVFLNYKNENRSNKKFATIDVLSDKAIGKAVSSNGKVFEEYELEVKISLYFNQDETINTVETFSDTLLQRFYKNTNLNITNIFLKPVRYSGTFKCLKSEAIFKLSYLLEETS